jgi:monofunctional biosynthetic peptidoglycan transglycosylase
MVLRFIDRSGDTHRLMLKRILVAGAALVGAFGLFEALTWPDVGALADAPPSTTAMIENRLAESRSEGRESQRIQQWVAIDKISPNLVRAVLAGEDHHFFTHDGFDYEAIQKAAEANWEAGEFKRGASTITQQLAKNLWLSESKNPLRKAKEAILTRTLESKLEKWRILEIYLNVIEWGDGVYGAEAAARTYFKTSAARLSPSQAAYLAAMIPNPRTVYNPAKNPRNVRRRQRIIERYMRTIRLPKRSPAT